MNNERTLFFPQILDKIKLAAWRAEAKASAKKAPLKIKGFTGRAQCGVCGHKWSIKYLDEQTACPACGAVGKVHPA